MGISIQKMDLKIQKVYIPISTIIIINKMGKCEFFNVCRLADKNSRTCTKDNGEYYGPGRMAGCGRDLSENGSNSSYHKDYIEPIIKKKSKKISKKLNRKK